MSSLTVTGVSDILPDGSYVLDDMSFHYVTRDLTLSYDANGGSAEEADGGADVPAQQDEYLAGLTVAGNAFAREGHRFLHWNTAADDSGTTFAPGDDLQLQGDTTLRAIRESDEEPDPDPSSGADSSNDNNGGSGSDSSQDNNGGFGSDDGNGSSGGPDKGSGSGPAAQNGATNQGGPAAQRQGGSKGLPATGDDTAGAALLAFGGRAWRKARGDARR